jgi:hypothetical protein
MWINSLNIDNGELYINNLGQDLKNGINFAKVIDYL